MGRCACKVNTNAHQSSTVDVLEILNQSCLEDIWLLHALFFCKHDIFNVCRVELLTTLGVVD